MGTNPNGRTSSSNLSPELQAQLREKGIAIVNGEVVEIKTPNSVVRAIKDGASEGGEIATKVVTTTGKGLAKVGEETAYYGLDIPAEGIKALVRTVRSSHRNRLVTKAVRRETKRQAKAEAARKAQAEQAKANAAKLASVSENAS